ncbi:protein-L-isoaspartate(D-aspartate) O-methyltransferase [Sphingomonas sp. YR710]|uniref:protein-L-isoaspartate O-methyltransferase family protein n=1 Tax=Sphingomonas sp. YR710 TaxID=1882773 RepID=UPI000882363C|nr:protein-L-isoaspartate O-methyltransferase [Sphingomonas sp. YR710]SDC97216.1 protein-L-isoaspartate(D-aspartate) O-methyltransferase [Sphingomonas sp. YR710]
MTEQNFEQMRRAMVVSQLRTTGVSDARVVSAMGSVPRERFVGPDRAALAYLDTPVPLGGGRALNPPMVTGRLLTEGQIVPGDKVLLIGAATGYAAAVLAALGAEVTAVEDDPALVAMGKAAAGSVTWVEAPLSAGYAGGAPYSLIVIDGAVEEIPAAIVDQLADGGRLVGAIVQDGVTRLVSGVRIGKGFGTKAFADADAVRLPGFARPKTFSF